MPISRPRRALAALAAVLLTAACGTSGADDLPPPDLRGPETDAPAPRRPAPTGEALWVVEGQESGTARLAAYDGATEGPLTIVDLGLSVTTRSLVTAVGDSTGIWVRELAGGGLVLVDPAAARVTARLTLPPRYSSLGMRYAGGVLWLSGQGHLVRVGPDGAVVPIRQPPGVAPGAAMLPQPGGGLLYADHERGLLLRVPAGGTAAETIATVPELRYPLAAALDASGLYAVVEQRVLRVDPDSGTVLGRVEGQFSWLIAAPGNGVWAVGAGGLIRVDGTPGRIGLDDTWDWTRTAPVAAAGAIWLGVGSHHAVVRVPLGGGAPARIPIGYGASEGHDVVLTPLSGQRSHWVLDDEHGVGVLRIDPDADRAVRVRPMSYDRAPTGVVATVPQEG